MSELRVLVIDDDDVVCLSCLRVLGEEGYDVEAAHSGAEGLARLEKAAFDVVLLDLKMPGMDGMEVLGRLRDSRPDVDVLIITGHATVETAVSAMKMGAFDYVTKPFTPDELSLVVKRVAEKRRLLTENRALQQELWAKYRLDGMIGTSRGMEDVFRRIAQVAATSTTVLILGESGVGKELVAKAIHYNSLRKDRPFVPVDCAGLPDMLLESELFGHVAGAFTGAIGPKRGLIEAASGGTLFLDEVANIPATTQAVLLRVLQEHEFRPVGDTRLMKADFRLLAATNRDLAALVKEGKFREDLYYRMNVFPIRVPPLRERREDVPALAMHFLRAASARQKRPARRVSAEAMSLLVAHDWGGNVRELANCVESAVVVAEGETVGREHLPVELGRRADGSLPTPATNEELKRAKKAIREQSIEPLERAFLVEALERNGWSVTQAAEQVGMQRTNFQALMKKHGIHVRDNGAEAAGE